MTDRAASASLLKKTGAPLAILAGITIALLSVAPAESRAQTLDEDELQQQGLAAPAKGKWNATVGVGVAAEPTFLGASHYRAAPIPLVSVEYDDLFFVGPQGIGVNVLNRNGFRAGPVLGMEYGRPESRDEHLRGLGSISPSLAGGGFLSYQAGPFSVVGSVRQSLTHTDHGLVGRIALDYKKPLAGGKVILAAGPVLDLVDGEYARTWFGVSQSQSLRSGLPAYRAHGGVRDIGLNGSATFPLGGHFVLRSFVDLRELVGSSSDSPIVQSRTQFMGGLGVAYRF